ncbi:MAG: PKD domain-containing protein [Chitinophagaceae bacterium]
MRFKFSLTAYLCANYILPLLTLCLSLFSFSVSAQLRADFTMDKIGGCSPLNISFTNTSGGITPNTTYQWDFGNGNTSVLKNAAAVFNEERQYTVSLTIKEGNQTAIQTKTVTVYKKPIVDFTFSPNNGCSPLNVSFTSSSSAGDGTMSVYQWDFGDGTSQQTPSPTIVHGYNFEQIPTISLTATNIYGCAGTITKSNIITVRKPLVVNFSANKTIACNAPADIQFTDHSTGPGALTYQWDFGDGNSSAQASPLHKYTSRGTFTVKLTVTSSEGCVKTFTRNNYINVEDFVTDFVVSAPVCLNKVIVFNNISTPVPDQSTWLIDGTTSLITYGTESLAYFFSTEGIHTIELTNNFGPCQQQINKQIMVNTAPVLNGFIADITGNCGAPVQVNFKDTTATAVSWQWNFDWYANPATVHSTQQTPSYTYTTDNIYQVSLTVTNAVGCTATTAKQVGISRPLIGIFLAPGSSPDGCGIFTVNFEPRTTEPITSYHWNFGDGGTSTVANPSHTFTQPGTYNVSLTYQTVSGCTGTANYNSIRVFTTPVADFTSLSGTTICGNSTAIFQNTSAGTVTDLYWYVNGGFVNYYSNQFNYNFPDTGQYTIQLIAANYGCRDTMVKTNYIRVLPPFPKIASVANTCDGNRDVATFVDGSRLVDNWRWDFGDGTNTSYNAAQSILTHTYPRSGDYKVTLTGTTGSCTVKDTTHVYILVKQHPLLTTSQTQICDDSGLNYTLSNLETRPNTGVWVNYIFDKMEYGDGSYFTGSNPNNFGYVDPVPYNGTMQGFNRSQDKIRFIIRETHFGCRDTSNYIPLSFMGTRAGFEVLADNVCFKSPVVFRDTSVISPGHPIQSWRWDFGDGVIQTYTQGGTVNHVYANPGSYYVSLKVTDGTGCSSLATSSRYVEVRGPKAAFSTSGTNVQLNTTVSFYNNSNDNNNINTAWQWNFGNNNTSANYSPTYTYTVPGDYLVSLVASNSQMVCRDTVKQWITVRDFNTGFTSIVSFIGNYNQCPPVLARFYNTSTNYTRLVWDFGDGTTLEDHPAPAHIYNVAGTYTVTLKVYGFNGLTGTFSQVITAGQPVVNIRADDIDGCIGQQVVLNAPVHTNAVFYLWDFGNGYMVNNNDSFALHRFNDAGIYTASLIAQDANGCRTSVVLADKITIYPNPEVNILPLDPIACKNIPAVLQATGASSYSWSPANGLNDPAMAAPSALPVNTTTYHVNGTDINGCVGNNEVTVIVPQRFDLNTVSDMNLCIGSTVQLNVTGAPSYQWINITNGLSSTIIPNPIASPSVSTVYTIVGYDQYNCYTDTVDINVHIRSLPTVNAGADKQVLYGSENVLQTSASSDVVRWNWTPADFLSCINCPTPVSKPYSPIDYIVTVYNQYNCKAIDTVSIKAACSGNGIYIPNAFSPNHDGKNDVFGIAGYGVSIIRSFSIYNRWGEIVFQKKNFTPDDIKGAWDGRLKGMDAPTGAYVYFIEMECNAGERFERKGTVTLVR